MKVLVLEENLLWSVRLKRSLEALGHEVETATAIPEGTTSQVAILNLGSGQIPIAEAVAFAHAHGLKTIAHAGHKEKELHELGKSLGVDLLATNSELTWKLEDLFRRLETA